MSQRRLAMKKRRQMDRRPPVANSQGLAMSVNMTSQGINEDNGMVCVVMTEGVNVGHLPLGNVGHRERLLKDNE